MPEKMHRSLRLRSGPALRWESPASRATPLPQDDKSGSKATGWSVRHKGNTNINSSGLCPVDSRGRLSPHLVRGLKARFPFLTALRHDWKSCPSRSCLWRDLSRMMLRKCIGPFGFAQGRLFVGNRPLRVRLRFLRMTNQMPKAADRDVRSTALRG